MTFEELSINADVAKLQPDHPLYPVERDLLQLLDVGTRHPDEHSQMVSHWGMVPDPNNRYNGKLTVLNGKKNRVWHLLLHYRFWKETGIEEERVKQLEKEYPQIILEEIPLPEV